MSKLWLDSMIRVWRSELRSELREELERGAEKHYLIKGAKRTRRATSILNKVQGRERCFLVYPEGKTQVEKLGFSLIHPGDGRVLNLQLDAQLSWDVERIDEGAAILGADTKPTATFARLVKERIAEWTKTHVEGLFEKYPVEIQNLIDNLRGFARDRLALLLSDVKIGPNPLDLRRLAEGIYSSQDLTVKAMDAPNQDIALDLRYKVGYERDNPILPLLKGFFAESVSASVDNLVRDEFLNSISLTPVVFDFPTKVRPKLDRRLREEMKELGGRLDWLEARLKSDFDVPINPVEVRTLPPITCDVKGAGTVEVSHTIRLEVKDAAKYLDAEQSSLESWAKRTVEDVTKACLFDHSYVDVAVYFSDREEEIRAKFKQKAERIGVEVQLHATTSPLPIVQAMREGVNVDTESEHWIFKVEDSPLPFIPLYVRGRIVLKDNEQLAHIFHEPSSPVQPLVVDDIREAIRGALLRTRAREYFSSFEPPDREPPEDGRRRHSVRETLMLAIRKRLKERYGKCELYLDIHREPDPVSERVQRLRNGKYDLEVEITPRGRRETVVKVPFLIHFSIENVDNYEQFVRHEYGSREEEIGNITKTWSGMLRKELNSLGPSVLVDYYTASREKWEELLEKIVIQSARATGQEFGLAIKVIYWDRESTLKEAKLLAIYEERIQAAAAMRLRDIKHEQTLSERKAEIVESHIDELSNEQGGAEKALDFIEGEQPESDGSSDEDLLVAGGQEETDEESVERSIRRLEQQQRKRVALPPDRAEDLLTDQRAEDED